LRATIESLLNWHTRASLPLEAETLSQRLKQGPLPLEEVLGIAIDIAAALDKTHKKGEIHGDLNPENILLSQGEAVAPHRPCSASLLTPSPALQAPSPPTGARELAPIVHSTQAPEQLQGQQADARTDIFALGAVMYEMATGRKAFEGGSKESLATAILTGDPPSMTAIQPLATPALERIVRTCLAKDPDERWQTARDLVRELEWIADTYAEFHPTKKEARRKKREFTALVVATILLFLLGLVSGILYLRRTPLQIGVKRFVLPPGNVGFDISPLLGFLISPDGRQVVTAYGSFLWLRPLNSLNAQRLMGTENGSVFCWSPDSRFVIFAKGKKLMRIEVAKGGFPQTICESPAGRFISGTSCSRDGLVLFSAEKIWKVPAEGGTPSAVTELDESHHETDQHFPAFLPDGRHFLYRSFRKKPEKLGIYLGSLDSKESKFLLDASGNIVYAQPGYLLYPRDGRLVAHPFDARRLSFTGDPAPIAEHLFVLNPNLTAYFSVSDTGTLLYYGGSTMGVQLTRVDRNGRKMETIGPLGDYKGLELSPDGDRVALEQGRPETEAADIWTMNLLTGRKTQITNSVTAWNYVPLWSPDGRQILFSSNRDQVDSGGSGGNFYVKEIAKDTGSETPLLKSSRLKWPSDWSPDGRYLLYNDDSLSQWLLPLLGDRKPTPFLESALFGRFSPNGRWVAYTAFVPPDKWDIIVRTFPLSEKKWQISVRNGAQPLWRKDGKELYYIEFGDKPDKSDKPNKLMAVEVKADKRSDDTFEASPPRALFDIPPQGGPTRYRYAASPDGQSFYVFSEDSQNQQVHAVLNWTELLSKK
jgi:Tol biopolymer transport system component